MSPTYADRMPKLLLILSIVLLAAAPVATQDEPALVRTAVEKLNAFATRCYKAKYPLRAREIWQEVLRDYDTDDEVARKALGFLRVGSSWAPDSRFRYPTADEPDPAVARILQKGWDGVCKELGAAHRDLAIAMRDGGMAERAKYHFERALRFLPTDSDAIAGSGRRSVEGLFGSDLELALLERSRKIDRRVAKLLDTDYDVAAVRSGTTHRLLDRGNVPYRGFESEHFVVWGDWEDQTLIDAAKHAERALALCADVYAGLDDFKWPVTKGKFHYAFFTSRETWAGVLQANADQFQPGALNFVLTNTSATGMGGGADHVRVCGFENAATVHDMAARSVAQIYSGCGADALVEGVGHAVVGWLFGRNLIFSVAQARADGRTTTGADRALKLQMPDLSVWAELAVEIAWEATDTPAAKLALVKASDFSSEDRIKSWSFCDYLLRRDPKLLRALDRCRTKSNSGQVATAFAEATGGLRLEDLDDAWRRFWTDDTPVLRAIRGKETPMESLSKAAPGFLGEFNDLRRALQREEVSWSAQYSAECKQHADYLLLNKRARGPEDEHTQDPGAKGGSLAGRQFAATALVSTSAKNAGKTFTDWLDLPGYRDALLNPTLTQVGIYVESGVLVMDVIRGQTGGELRISQFPFGVAPGSGLGNNAPPGIVVPTDVAVAELGPDVERAFAAAGQKPPKKVGYPISLHFFRSGALPATRSIRCTLKLNDKDAVDGVVTVADGGVSRCASAPGLVVFYPSAPLKRGAAYTVEWSFERGGRAETLPAYQFFTK